jgi:hypothetical protein
LEENVNFSTTWIGNISLAIEETFCIKITCQDNAMSLFKVETPLDAVFGGSWVYVQ